MGTRVDTTPHGYGCGMRTGSGHKNRDTAVCGGLVHRRRREQKEGKEEEVNSD